ncbi:response regulator [Sphingomonas piscis]|uniref:Response regulator n=1 Tax=Sphingomonas piscis TaxID=2714943 RepID=A0A6G7YNR6_9SPHN|nr:response regulator [Sphingomonas piscis]QIK78366.1 response regulator [Sphingomonas piscis]
MSKLAGKRVLIVEDEAIIAFAIEDMLVELGCVIIGPALRLDEACDLADTELIDAAILDVNINSERSYPVADRLHQRGVPFVFATGYDREGLEWRGSDPEIIAKPYRRDQVQSALERMID